MKNSADVTSNSPDSRPFEFQNSPVYKQAVAVAKETTEATGAEVQKDKTRSRMSWAKLLNRVFKIDITQCQFCRGEVKVISAILEKRTIEKILRHLGLPTEPPPIYPARPPPQPTFDDFDHSHGANSYDF